MRAVDQHGSPANLFADMEDALIRARREVRHLDAYRSGMFLPARYLQFRLEQAVEDSTLARSPAEVGNVIRILTTIASEANLLAEGGIDPQAHAEAHQLMVKWQSGELDRLSFYC